MDLKPARIAVSERAAPRIMRNGSVGTLAPFGGLEWLVNPKLRVLAEYSSDDYGLEQGYFDHR